MRIAFATFLLALLSACQVGKATGTEERYAVRMVRYFGADGRLPANRVILCGDTLFHSADELVQIIEAIDPPRTASFFIENGGSCDELEAEFTDAEIDLLMKVCRRKGFDCHFRREKPNQPLVPTPGLRPVAAHL